jgi:hypothetical protein
MWASYPKLVLHIKCLTGEDGLVPAEYVRRSLGEEEDGEGGKEKEDMERVESNDEKGGDAEGDRDAKEKKRSEDRKEKEKTYDKVNTVGRRNEKKNIKSFLKGLIEEAEKDGETDENEKSDENMEVDISAEEEEKEKDKELIYSDIGCEWMNAKEEKKIRMEYLKTVVRRFKNKKKWRKIIKRLPYRTAVSERLQKLCRDVYQGRGDVSGPVLDSMTSFLSRVGLQGHRLSFGNTAYEFWDNVRSAGWFVYVCV